MNHAAMKLAASAAMVVTLGMSANAADIIEPVVIETPVHYPEAVPAKVSGWYIRGDVGYLWSDFRGADYLTYGAGVAGHPGLLEGELKGSLSVGGGVGYQISHYLRTDLTLDYNFKSDFTGTSSGTCTIVGGGGPAACSSTDTTGYHAWTLLANAYVDLGTYKGITPYVGAGLGGVYMKWDDLNNTIGPGFDQSGTITHSGTSDWRFAYALMAGASYAVNHRLSVDLGYRYKHISGGRMFEYASATGPGFDRAINVHEVRAGLRYKFGESHQPYTPPPPVYEPPVVYK
ncbi:MAG: porin family protein [Roseitalea sp.]|jgi:opacity protein-like surface antigen|uniref:Porin family protein n=2 Tax=Oceaniradius stylonematis TaxID=2184161 RepID=A0A3A8AJI3_9HYPH|nr:porin family protein [Roseitalea sp.]MBO6951872.1 porin family protein [Rhizobiaceae bacterium]RKF06003.1 porin family protein [Oceaniradius stylonematis]RNC95701.1 MAG: porin family protein [Oricola sp.]MBO6592282.1 porin family protein [Roseitalea sp.]